MPRGSWIERTGLLDMRSMAGAYFHESDGANAANDAPDTECQEPDPQLSLLMPQPAKDAHQSKLLYALLGAAGMLAIVVVMLAVLVVKGLDDQKTSTASADEIADTVPEPPVLEPAVPDSPPVLEDPTEVLLPGGDDHRGHQVVLESRPEIGIPTRIPVRSCEPIRDHSGQRDEHVASPVIVIELEGLGKAWTGLYYVVGAIHVLTRDAGYATQFEVRRPGTGDDDDDDDGPSPVPIPVPVPLGTTGTTDAVVVE